MQKLLAQYVLKDLLENYFEGNKTHMAKRLQLTVRTLQRILNNEEPSRNGNTALSRALLFYVENGIPLRQAFQSFVQENDTSCEPTCKVPASCRTWIDGSSAICDTGREQIQELNAFLGMISESVCPSCILENVSHDKLCSESECILVKIGTMVQRETLKAQ